MKIEFKSLPYIPLRITSKFGKREVGNIKGATSWHSGIDIGRDKRKYNSAPAGNILSVMDGIITHRDYNKDRGYYIIIKHQEKDGNKIETLYQHLHSEGLSVGTVVKSGQIIGRMGCSGVGNGIHLHFELRINDKCVDPLPYLLEVNDNTKNTCNATTNCKKNENVYYSKIKEKFKFSDETMEYLENYKYSTEMFYKILNNKSLDSNTIKFIKEYKYSNEVLERFKNKK